MEANEASPSGYSCLGLSLTFKAVCAGLLDAHWIRIPSFLLGSTVAGAHIAGQGNKANHSESRRVLSRWVLKPMARAFAGPRAQQSGTGMGHLDALGLGSAQVAAWAEGR